DAGSCCSPTSATTEQAGRVAGGGIREGALRAPDGPSVSPRRDAGSSKHRESGGGNQALRAYDHAIWPEQRRQPDREPKTASLSFSDYGRQRDSGGSDQRHQLGTAGTNSGASSRERLRYRNRTMGSDPARLETHRLVQDQRSVWTAARADRMEAADLPERVKHGDPGDAGRRPGGLRRIQ